MQMQPQPDTAKDYFDARRKSWLRTVHIGSWTPDEEFVLAKMINIMMVMWHFLK